MSDDTFLVAEWPVLCDECTKALAKHVYDRHDLNAVTLFCPHQNTLVMARTGEHEGMRAVIRWDVIGPVAAPEAAEMIRGLGGAFSMENLDAPRVH